MYAKAPAPREHPAQPGPDSRLRIEEIPLGDRRIREFARLPWRLRRGDPNWTPPLNAELLGSRLLGMTGLLTPRHAYHRHADVTHFLAWRGSQPVGRVSAAINRRFNEHHHVRIGFFGFFEVANDYEAAAVLLDRARDWVKARGMTVLRGPGEYSNATHERQGVLIDGFNYPPTFDLTHNPPYYGEFLERYGFRKAKDYHAYVFDVNRVNLPQVKTVAAAVRRRRKFELRPIVMKTLRDEVRKIIEVYNEAWSQNWGFLPILEEEADAIVGSLAVACDPKLIRFAIASGELAAVMGVLPDPNYCLRPRWRWYGDSDFVRLVRLMAGRRRIPRLRFFFMGVRPKYRMWGFEAVLADELLEYAYQAGYRTCETSLLLEDNERVIGVSEFMGARRYKTWRIYDLPLEPPPVDNGVGVG